MKNILVVDDEQLIANGISMLIKSFDLPLHSVKTLFDSQEAVDYCQNNEVDIVITDINMPVLNGIQLIKQIKLNSPQIQIIIITGFGTLSYAKEAMALGVQYFLEKPITKQAIFTAVTETIDHSNKVTMAHQLVIKQEIEQYILTGADASLHSLMTVDFPITLYIFDSAFSAQVSKIVKPISSQLTLGYVSKTGYILVNNIKIDHSLRDLMLNEGIIKRGIMIHCFIEKKNDFLKTFYLAKQNLDKIFYFSNFTIIDINKIITSQKQYCDNAYNDFHHKLFRLINQGELTKAKISISYFYSESCLTLYPVQLLRLQTIDLITEIIDTYKTKKDASITDYSQKIMLLNTWYELQYLLLHCIDLIKQNVNLESDTFTLSQKMNLIIEMHYAEETLSLKWVANNLLYLNPEYLGKAYYKESGIRFNQKLAEYRIEVAKKLLLENHRAYEVALLTGFGNSPEYFIQIFKKITGYTPKSYVLQNKVPV